MSAINDALRRASSVAKSGPRPSPLAPMPVAAPSGPAAPPPPPPMPAASARTAPAAPPPIISSVAGAAPESLSEDEPAKTRSKLPLVLVLLLIGGLGAAGGGYYFWKQKHYFVHAREPAPRATEELTDNDRIAALFGDEKAAKKIAADVGAAAPPAQNKPAPIPPPEPAPKPAPAVTAPPPAPAPVNQAPVRFPPLRLQSIFYRPSNPSVIINGKTLFVTDEINGVTVVDIQPASVTLVLSGQTNTLTLR